MNNTITETMSAFRLSGLHLDLLNKARIAWEVVQEPLITPSGRLTKEIGLFRSDNDYHLGTHSERYQVCQNAELAKLVVYAASDIEDLNIETMRGGVLQNGRKIYIQIALATKSINGHEMKSWLTALNSHDGTTTVSFGSTKTLVICQNTFFQAYRSEKMTRVLHHSTMKEKLAGIAEAMKESIALDQQLDRVFERMAEKKVNHDEIKGLRDMIFVPVGDDKEESTRRINNLAKFHQAVDIEFATHGENAWGLFNGVTRYTNHHMAVRKDNDRISNVMVGTGAKINTMAFNYLAFQS